MTNIFSILFDYEGQTYMALVSVNVRDKGDVSFYINIPDEGLHFLIPEGRLVFNTVKGMEVPEDLRDQDTCELVLAIAEAISKHLSIYKL